MKNWNNELNKKYNRLTIKNILPQRKGKTRVVCTCDCGEELICYGSSVLSGNTKSCGCLKIEKIKVTGKNNKTHGKSKEPSYGCYIRMIDRCHNEKSSRYFDYGGRGISVCERWRCSIDNFLEDMGERPSKNHTIDRIDNDGDYEPSNCKWSTYKEQNKNKRIYKNGSIYGAGIYKKGDRFLAFYSDIYIGSFKFLDKALEAREVYINEKT